MLNIVALMGRLTDEPKLFTSKDGKEGGSVSVFTLAVNEGEARTSFIDIKVFDKDKVVSYLHKGDQIGITGRLVQEKFTRKDGTQGSTLVVVANNIEFGQLLEADEEPDKGYVQSHNPESDSAVKPVAKPARKR